METFINRWPELKLVENVFSDLQSSDTFLRTPIIDFYGVDGIGKTSILKKIMQMCNRDKVNYLWVNTSKSAPEFLNEILSQAKQYNKIPLDQNQGEAVGLLDRYLTVAQTLLGKGPLVMLFDAVDADDEDTLESIEEMLSSLIVNNRFFAVLTSRRGISFEQRDVARKLTTLPLQPLDRAGSEEYLGNVGFPDDPELHAIIFEWTHGYPLAMKVMVEAIQQGINPRNEQGKQMLLATIMQQVIDQTILARVELAEHAWFHKVLRLLSVPRRFNLLIMQNLIETFSSDLRLANSLAYIIFPKRISQSTDVLSWNLDKGGFAIDSPIRHLFLLQLKIEGSDSYSKINAFLAKTNQDYAAETDGPDSIRYRREYLYHIASNENEQQLPQILETTVQSIIRDAENAPELLTQFLEEFSQDTELKDLLGQHTTIVFSLIYKQLAQSMFEYALHEKEEGKRIEFVRQFLRYTHLHDPIHDLPSHFRTLMDRLEAQEDAITLQKLRERFEQDSSFSDSLGNEFFL